MGKRATKAEQELRVAAITQLILDGADHNAIVRFSAENWGIAERQTEDYEAEARREIKKVAEARRENAWAEHVGHRMSLRRRAKIAKQYKLEFEVAKDEAKLLGVYPSEKYDIKQEIEITGGYSDDELIAKANSIISRREADAS